MRACVCEFVWSYICVCEQQRYCLDLMCVQAHLNLHCSHFSRKQIVMIVSQSKNRKLSRDAASHNSQVLRKRQLLGFQYNYTNFIRNHIFLQTSKFDNRVFFAAGSRKLYYRFEPKFYVNFRQSEVFLNRNINHTS